jgi:hypothetical protein
MTDVLAVRDAGPTLLRELMLLEHGICPDPVQADLLYEHRSSLQPYLDRRLLALAFQGNKPCVRATGFVGLLPFVVSGAPHLLLVAPKGCQHRQHVGLLRFLELLTFHDGASLPEDAGGWEGQLGPHPFLLFLARHYATVLRELCRRDFRSHYRGDEGDLRGRIRGRLRLGAYASLAVRGRSHVLPCRWDEITVDNWDNRILWGVARRLAQLARVLDPEAARSVWGPFGHLLSWFGSVTEVSVSSDISFSRSATIRFPDRPRCHVAA